VEFDGLFVIIRCWWLSSGTASKASVHEQLVKLLTFSCQAMGRFHGPCHYEKIVFIATCLMQLKVSNRTRLQLNRLVAMNMIFS
jgi:hypothetical protein